MYVISPFRTEGIEWKGQRQETMLLMNTAIPTFRTFYRLFNPEKYPRDRWQIAVVRIAFYAFTFCGHLNVYVKKYYVEKME